MPQLLRTSVCFPSCLVLQHIQSRKGNFNFVLSLAVLLHSEFNKSYYINYACFCMEIAHDFISWFRVIPMNEQSLIREGVLFAIFKKPENTDCAVTSQSKMNSKICSVFTNFTHNEVLERAADTYLMQGWFWFIF